MKRKKKNNMDKEMGDLIPDLDLNSNNSDPDVFTVDDLEFTPEYAAKVDAYNESIEDVSEDYASFKPAMEKLLVRAFQKPLVMSEAGIVLPNRESVAFNTKAGVGFQESIVDPYGFKRMVVVINAGPAIEKTYPAGTILYTNSPISANPFGRGGEVGITLNDSFVHPNSNIDKMPTDPSDVNFGYFLINGYDVIGSNKSS